MLEHSIRDLTKNQKETNRSQNKYKTRLIRQFNFVLLFIVHKFPCTVNNLPDNYDNTHKGEAHNKVKFLKKCVLFFLSVQLAK